MVLPRLDELEQALGHRFRDSSLLERALTHSSAVADGAREPSSSDNEQLEYLGDAVLGMLVSDYLVGAFPHWSEGQLSRGRARLVNAASLSAAAQRLGLGEHMLLGRGEERTGGRQKPTLLADAFEALVAAIYVDAGLGPAREFVARALLSTALDTESHRLGRADNKSELQELLQRWGGPGPRYQVVRETGPDHQKTFWVEVTVPGRVTATGAGPNKKEAEQAAAEQALEQLRGVQAGQRHE
jgi:ribonuclease-3